jgi:hypothetical protein
MLQIVLAVASCAMLSVFALILGSTISSNAKNSLLSFHPQDYFIGVAFFIILMRILYIPLNNLRATMLVTLFLSVVYILPSAKKIFSKLKECTFNPTTTLVLATLTLIYLSMAIVPITEFDEYNLGFLDPWGGHTTLVHSFRASNLAITASDLNAFPVINQNISQSVLALLITIPTKLAPLGIFPIQMAITLVFLTLLISKILSSLGIPKKLSIFLATFVLFLNSSMGSVYTSATDTGSALFLLRSHDALLGFGIILTIANQLFESKNLLVKPSKFKKNLIIPCILVASLSLVFGSYAFFIPFLVMALPLEKIFDKNQGKTHAVEELNFIQSLKTRLIISSYLSLSFVLVASINGFLMLINRNLEMIPSSERGSLSPRLRQLFEPENFVWPREAWYAYTARGGGKTQLIPS